MNLIKALALERGNLAAGFLLAATLMIPNGTGPVPMIAYVPPGTAVNIMAPKPKPKADYVDGLGNPIPLDNFDNDMVYNPDVDVTPYADLEKELDAELAKRKPKAKD